MNPCSFVYLFSNHENGQPVMQHLPAEGIWQVAKLCFVDNIGDVGGCA